jgi:hypothetical protein
MKEESELKLSKPITAPFLGTGPVFGLKSCFPHQLDAFKINYSSYCSELTVINQI